MAQFTALCASDYATRIAGEVKDFDITQYGVDKKEARRMDRSLNLQLVQLFWQLMMQN